MKRLFLLLAAVGLLLPLHLHAAPPAPAVSIEQALQLAQKYLADRGLTGAHQIVSISLEDSAIAGGRQYWSARWTPSIKGDDKTSESGLQIGMDGVLARVVSGGKLGAGRVDVPGQRRVGARNIR